MIERDIELPDGRVLHFHKVGETLIDTPNNNIYVITRSYENENTIDHVNLRAIVEYDVYDPALIADAESIISTEELKLYVGIEVPDIVTVESLKSEKRKSINDHRDLLEKAGFPYMDKMLDSDSQSVSRITVTASAAMACIQQGQQFSVTWTCADNSTIELDAEGMIAMPQALAAHSATLHYRATELKGMVEAITSTDIEEVKALLADIPDS